LWAHWFSKNQGIFPSECVAPKAQYYSQEPYKNHELSWKILESGTNPKIEISLRVENDCIALVYAGPLSLSGIESKGVTSIGTLAEYPFWEQKAVYFNDILSKPEQIIQVGLGEFIRWGNEGDSFYSQGYMETHSVNVWQLPEQILTHKDTISKSGKTIKVLTTLDMAHFNESDKRNVTIYVGFYSWFNDFGSATPSGWRVTTSANSWTARYSKGSSTLGGQRLYYFTKAIKIPISDLRVSAKAAADAKAASNKKTTITCIKGKLTKKVTVIKPKCPAGYKKK
jgi:hypothetical protein